MKKIAPVLALLTMATMPAHALEDDLFWKEGAGQGPTLRSFQWQGRLYQNIRIANYDGRNVELTTGKETFSVPEGRIPPLWRSAVHRRSWPGLRQEQPVEQLPAGRVSSSLPGKPAPEIMAPEGVVAPEAEPKPEREPAPIPEFTTYREWMPARAAALAKARGKAAAAWPDDYVKQLEQVRAQMDAWDALYPRPGTAKDHGPQMPSAESTSGQDAKTEEFFRVRSVPLPSDLFPSDIIEIRTYNNRRVAARVEALATAKKLAVSKWAEPKDEAAREAEEKRLMALWDDANFEMEAPR